MCVDLGFEMNAWKFIYIKWIRICYENGYKDKKVIKKSEFGSVEYWSLVWIA